MDYYTPENMKGKKISDLRQDPSFLSDAATFLKSNRKGLTDEDLAKFTADDVVDEVLEHFRMGSVNEVTMAKDLYYVNDDQVPESDRQAYGRLLFSFDNAEGEGMLDRGGEKIYDYAKGIASAPSTYASVAAGLFTGGAGGAAVQATKAGATIAVRKVANKLLGRAAMVGAIDGSIAGGSQLGLERIKQTAGKSIDEEYNVNMGNVALAGALGAGVGAAGYLIPASRRNKVANRLVDSLDMGREANVTALLKANTDADTAIKEALTTKEGKKRMKYTTDKLLRGIDPALVKEGMDAKYDILSDTLPDGLIGGLDRSTLRRISAASFELSKAVGTKPEPGQRITEFLAKKVADEGTSFFDDIAKKYGLSNRQLSAVYAAEVSEAAKILADQSALVRKGGAAVSGAIDGRKFADDIRRLYNEGMSTIDPEDAAKVLDEGADGSGIAGRAWRSFKNIESTRRALMTSQVATTMRNNIFGVAMTGIDMLDRFNLSMVRALQGKGKQSVSTFQGAASTFKYLTADNAVAEALIKTLQQDAPEQLSRVFQDAAMAESLIMKQTRLGKIGKAFNVLNTMSDHTFKKAVIASNLDRQFRANGSTLMKEMEAGRLGQITTEMLNDALDESLAFTFQRRLGGKGATTENKAAKAAVDLINKSGLTVLIPFPRYMASQAKFISDYTGLTLIRRGATGRPITAEEVSKTMTGAAMFGGLYKIQEDNIKAGLEWFEASTDDGQEYNAQAALGPAALHAYMANLSARIFGGHEVKNISAIQKDIGKIVIGTEFRPSGTPIDKAARAIESGNWQPMMDLMTDYGSAFTYPAAVLKDFYGQLDPRSSYFPETRDPSMVSMFDMDGWQIPMAVYQRATRQLPDLNLDTMANALREMSGIDIDPEKLKGIVDFAQSSTRATFQTKFSNNKDQGYDAVRMDIFGDGPLRQTNPILKQIIGMAGKPRGNTVKKEFVRLQIDPFTVYNPYREKNPAVSVLAEQLMQGHLVEHLKKLMASNLYQTATVEEQKLLLVGGNALSKKADKGAGLPGAKDLIADYRAYAREALGNMASDPEYQGDFMSYTRGRLKAVGTADRKFKDALFARMTEGTRWEGKTLQENLEAIKTDETLLGENETKDVLATNLIHQYLMLK